MFLLVVSAAACGRNEANGQTGSGSTQNHDTEREQARFDAERKPEKVVEALGIKPGSRVADIGAGSGLLTIHLARAVQPNGRVVATDIENDVLQNMLLPRLQAAGLAEYVERRVVNADTPGLEAGSYDAILLAEVDHYFGDPVAWLKSAATALKPGGRIVISNRIHHRAKSMAAAQKAGLKLASESAPVPTHFIAVFVVENK
jgi:2-polyprenyl-3-methyl-5-hydroxy-6-metoxy-1,4-benzoquinol methylase